jgi:hypothetical protein
MGNAYNSRPEIQARHAENRRNPEWVRHEAVIAATKGKFLGHFKKKELASRWRREWIEAGKPLTHDLPEFDEWLQINREALILERDIARERQRMHDVFHDDWLASGQPATPRSPERSLELVAHFRATSPRGRAEATLRVADQSQRWYERERDEAASDIKRYRDLTIREFRNSFASALSVGASDADLSVDENPLLLDTLAAIDGLDVVDDVSAALGKRGNELEALARSKRGTPEWQEICLAMGAVRNAAASAWRVSYDSVLSA